MPDNVQAHLQGPRADAFVRVHPKPCNFMNQVEAALAVDPTGFQSISDLPVIIWNNRRFAIESQINNTRSGVGAAGSEPTATSSQS